MSLTDEDRETPEPTFADRLRALADLAATGLPIDHTTTNQYGSNVYVRDSEHLAMWEATFGRPARRQEVGVDKGRTDSGGDPFVAYTVSRDGIDVCFYDHVEAQILLARRAEQVSA